MLVVEEELRERLGQLGLADAGRAEEQERAGRPVRVGDAGPRAPDGVGDGPDRRALPDQALAQPVLHVQELLGLALAAAGRWGCRSSWPRPRRCPAALTSSLTIGVVLLLGLVGARQLLLQRRDLAVADLAGPDQVALAQRPVGLDPQLVDLRAQLADLVEALLLGLPARLEPAQLLARVGQLGLQPLQPRDADPASVSFSSASAAWSSGRR